MCREARCALDAEDDARGAGAWKALEARVRNGARDAPYCQRGVGASGVTLQSSSSEAAPSSGRMRGNAITSRMLALLVSSLQRARGGGRGGSQCHTRPSGLSPCSIPAPFSPTERDTRAALGAGDGTSFPNAHATHTRAHAHTRTDGKFATHMTTRSMPMPSCRERERERARACVRE